MSNPQLAPLHVDNESGHQGENNNIAPSNEILHADPVGIPIVDPIDANSHVSIDAKLPTNPENNVSGGARSVIQNAQNVEGDGINLRMIFEMLQAQQAAITQLQNQSRARSWVEPDPPREAARRDVSVVERSNEHESGDSSKVIKMLEEPTKRIESGEKKIDGNDKKVETYNSREDQIPGALPILKGLDSRKFVQKPFPPRNDLEDDEIESMLLKKFGETPSKRAMIWYHNLPPNSIDSFAMLADSFVKTHAGAIKVETRKSNLFKVREKDNKMLGEFVSRFQMERMELPPVADDWTVQAFTQGLNVRSSVDSQQLKQNLIKYPAVTWADVHNRYQSKIRVEDDQLGAPPGSIYPINPVDRIRRDIN
ncbi:uncharacterized protein [Nicotiana tomentosiformis]|uniref:uncharacterized protein n=1 Tax=Nicotiana tomentosiformis TaxID=4098 RepID=UPI00388CCC74